MGTHGTSRSKAEAIVAENSFKPTGPEGYSGSGIYFWAYGQQIDTAKHLAELWWRASSQRGNYSTDKNKECAVISAQITDPGEPEYYDASTEEFRSSVASLATSLTCQEEFNLAEATATVLAHIEKQIGKKILVLKALVKSPAPKGQSSVIAKNFPMWNVYVVRDGGEKLFTKIEILN